MLRTVEAIFMVVITFGAMLAVTNYVYLPPPRITSSIGQQEYAQDLLQRIDENKALTNAVFSESGEGWSSIVKTLVDILPPNVVFNITAYKISEDVPGTLRYVSARTGSNFKGAFPSGSVSISYTMTSPEATVTQTPEKIGYKDAGGTQMYTTLYILKCSDANGWWVTGFTGETLAQETYNEMSAYFDTTVVVNNTDQFERLLNGFPLTGSPSESVRNAIILNMLGEAVPIPSSWVTPVGKRYQFPYYLGQRAALYNWTWVSVVGYPFYYVSNKNTISGQNNWGIYGMTMLSERGVNAFLQGVNWQGAGVPPYTGNYVNNTASRTSSIGVVSFTNLLKENMNYYGIYPGHTQTSTRAFSKSGIELYNFHLKTNFFNPVGGFYAGAVWAHTGTDGKTHGSLMAIGLARTPDLRVAILGILAVYRPSIYRSDFSVSGTTRIVTLQIGQLGGS
jgi:hypothetical protein